MDGEEQFVTRIWPAMPFSGAARIFDLPPKWKRSLFRNLYWPPQIFAPPFSAFLPHPSHSIYRKNIAKKDRGPYMKKWQVMIGRAIDQ